MKIRFYSHLLAICCSLIFLGGCASASAQDKPKVTVPEAEQKATAAITGAADINAKMAAAEDFIKKYPRSAARPQVADYIVSQILGVESPDQKLALAQKYPSIFNDPNEADLIKPAVIDAYVKQKKFDDAFSEGATYFGKHP